MKIRRALLSQGDSHSHCFVVSRMLFDCKVFIERCKFYENDSSSLHKKPDTVGLYMAVNSKRKLDPHLWQNLLNIASLEFCGN